MIRLDGAAGGRATELYPKFKFSPLLPCREPLLGNLADGWTEVLFYLIAIPIPIALLA